MRKFVRSVQVHFPFLQNAQFAIKRWYQRVTGIPFEADFNALALFPDEPGMVYLDVGANRGLSTDAILTKTRNSRVILFEPNARVGHRLRRMYAHHPRVTVYAIGLGEETGRYSLYVPCYRRWSFDSLGSMSEVHARDWLKDALYFYNERRLTVRRQPCAVKPLDSLNLKPFFIKLDVQGHELAVLKGGLQTLRRHEPVLLVEAPDAEVTEYLAAFGYEPYAYERGRFKAGVMGKLNTFYMTPAKAALAAKHIDRS